LKTLEKNSKSVKRLCWATLDQRKSERPKGEKKTQKPGEKKENVSVKPNSPKMGGKKKGGKSVDSRKKKKRITKQTRTAKRIINFPRWGEGKGGSPGEKKDDSPRGSVNTPIFTSKAKGEKGSALWENTKGPPGKGEGPITDGSYHEKEEKKILSNRREKRKIQVSTASWPDVI